MHRFDTIVRDPQGADLAWDRALGETASFIALPSLGSLVPGWVLIVPRRPMLNLAGMTAGEWDELDEFLCRVVQRLKVFNGDPFFFEHGSRTIGGPLGCGVDQAHLHVVPLPFDLVEASLFQPDATVSWERRSGLESFAGVVDAEREYIGILNAKSGEGAKGRVARPQSQWVRRVIARELGIEADWNYREHPQLSNILKTVDAFFSE